MASDTAGLTIIIEGGDRWAVPQRDDERRRMATYVERIGDVPTRCADCAFRSGTAANSSRLVLHLIESCLSSHDNGSFCCHHGDDPTRPCAGYAALYAVLGGSHSSQTTNV